MKHPLLLSAISFALLGAGCSPATSQVNPRTPSQPVACTMEAKQCPDGSYVGRSGPNCEFSACPSGY